MAREAQIIGSAVDSTGEEWDVRERRPTAHGFDILVGWPKGVTRGRGGSGGPSVIATAELAHYLTETRLRDVTLPIGPTLVKRLRAAIGISWSWDDWWAAKADDLASMTLEAFCVRYGCSMGAASQRRAVLRS